MEIKKEPTAIICLSPYRGGMELDAISFSKKLQPFMKTLLIIKRNSFMEDKLKNENIDYETIEFFKSFSLSIILNARKIIKLYGIKNVIFFGASELKSLYFSFLRLDINLIIRHSTTKSRPKKDWFHRLIYSNVNYNVSTSKHLLKNVRTIIPFGKITKEKLIYSSFEFKEPFVTQHKQVTLLHTGRIADAKGQIDAIQACSILVENNIDFKFYLVGGIDESYKSYFMDFYNNLEYKDKIELVGFTNNVTEYLHKSDIFIFPSYGEGISISFREALANNMICISYNNTSFPELKELGLKFHLCENKNIDELRNILISTIKNIDEEKKSIEGNYNTIQNIFSEKHEVNNYFELLK